MHALEKGVWGHQGDKPTGRLIK